MAIKITAVSDLHGCTPDLPGGDLLILGGDYTARDKIPEWKVFFDWLKIQPYRKKILIAGNHDNFLSQCLSTQEAIDLDIEHNYEDFEYLRDSGTEFEGYKIWGSPWTLRFRGMNPECMAFTCQDNLEMEEKWKHIPDDTDILITHSPPFGILDQIDDKWQRSRVGCRHLIKRVKEIKPKVHIFGHIHEHGGTTKEYDGTLFINAAYMNMFYNPENEIVTFELPEKK